MPEPLAAPEAPIVAPAGAPAIPAGVPAAAPLAPPITPAAAAPAAPIVPANAEPEKEPHWLPSYTVALVGTALPSPGTVSVAAYSFSVEHS